MGYQESWSGKINRKLIKKQHIIDVAAGRVKADLVLKNATYVDVFSEELATDDIAVAEGLIVGLGSYSGIEEVDMTGFIVCPGFLDAHIHLESSLVSPFSQSGKPPFLHSPCAHGPMRRQNSSPVSWQSSINARISRFPVKSNFPFSSSW